MPVASTSPTGAEWSRSKWTPHGALRSRLHKRGEVLGRTRSTRLLVRFASEHERVSIRPHLVRVTEEDPGG